ncbi:helix-turn-helix transcriptional regulator [Clostridium intestinale]|uniref:Putative transcriptional regulator n=1 Tax=Clostridium intestinale URNW TaxID=1294142 RepID=U2PUL6_9CLOT|nr:YafY family protein [Clostridium intestinale]ERK30120.1 putative transcriptional regulator [Clostridium intestinale URNW]
MSKSERINDMMIYLNDKNFFNLKDLMDRYDISKSTALRDVTSLEEMGMPIFSEPGRNGRYGVLKNKLLSPIVFTVDEMSALYFSMLTLKAYESTPFHLKLETLKRKFEMCLSEGYIDELHKMEEILRFEVSKHNNSSPLLKDILKAAIEEQVCSLIYTKKGIRKEYKVQFFDITANYGQWYVTAFNFEAESIMVFRCDKIDSIYIVDEYKPKSIKELKEAFLKVFKRKEAIDFEIEVSNKGVGLFYKEHYPSMNLYIESKRNYIKGFYNKEEEKFISNYFINYSDSIISIKPNSLKELMVERVSSLSEYYKKMMLE